MGDPAQDPGRYLGALHNIHSLTLANTRVERTGEEEFRTRFSVFRETLTCLFLDTFTTSFSGFVVLVNYFPNITTLGLRFPIPAHEKNPVPSLSRPLRGKLHVCGTHHHLKFFSQFAKLELEYEELVIDSLFGSFMETKYLESIIQISASTVKFLRLTARLRCE